VTAFRLHGDGCTVSTRLVETPRAVAQRRAGLESGFAARGAWTQAASVWRNLFAVPTNPANTAPLVWAGKLLALCEGGARRSARGDAPGRKRGAPDSPPLQARQRR
jgi:carotenoid cleavage dioxygenase-like enzyme